jgi:dihydrolipoamide dehydrogenase
LAKLLGDPIAGTILAFQAIHYHADVVATITQLAVEMELHIRDIPDRASHPTSPGLLDGLFREAASELDR